MNGWEISLNESITPCLLNITVPDIHFLTPAVDTKKTIIKKKDFEFLRSKELKSEVYNEISPEFNKMAQKLLKKAEIRNKGKVELKKYIKNFYLPILKSIVSELNNIAGAREYYEGIEKLKDIDIRIKYESEL